MSEPLRKRILLVEDEALIAMNEQIQLEKYGYAVRVVTSGEKAIETVESSSDIDLILMDINLGAGIDGTQAAEAILTEQDIPVVFLSSHTDPEVVEKTEKITSYGYVVKNSNVAVLDASIKMAFKLFDAKIAAQKNEESLRRSEEKYRLQFMHMTSYNSMYEVIRDADGIPCDFRFLMVNRAYAEYVGRDAAELVGMTLLEAFPRTEQYWLDQMSEVAITGKPITYENYSTELDTWIEINLFVPQEGQLVMTSTNVTERKRMERDLNESVSRYQELVGRIPIGVYVVWLRANGGKDFEYVSDRWCEIHGVSRERVLTDSSVVDDLVYPGDKERFVNGQREASQQMKPFRWEGRFCRSDGEVRWVLIESIPHLHENGDIRWFGINQDITERKRAEEQYRLLFQYSNDAIFVHELGDDNLPARNIDVNEQASTLLGYTREELLTLSARDVVPKERAPAMYQHSQELIKKRHLTFESENIRRDGVVIPVEVSAYLHIEGTRRLVVSSVRDITDRKAVENEVQKQLSEKEVLLREVHHRVKNNIATIESLVSLQIGDTVSPDVTAALQETLSRVQSIRVLYEKLLISDELAEISMNDYIESLLDALVMVFDPGRTITVETRIAAIDIPSETAVSVGIIINELLTNVFKYAFAGRDDGCISISIDKPENEGILNVRDNGVGIDETITERPSPGFGLTIVSMLAEQLHGTLEYTRDNGTLVTVTFPL